MPNLFRISQVSTPLRRRVQEASRATQGGGRDVVLVLLASCIAVPIACGGGQAARDGAQSPDTASSAASLAPTSASASPPPAGASAGPTTTVAPTDGADVQGTKLTETHAVAPPSASSAPAKTTHLHDPGRGAADIQAVVSARRDEARACFDRALAEHPGIGGDLVITWTIDPKGNVTQTSVDTSRSQISEPTAIACISDIIRKIQFAPSPGGFETKAFYPFNFRPHHGKPAQ
jgi:hypothetical protein